MRVGLIYLNTNVIGPNNRYEYIKLMNRLTKQCRQELAIKGFVFGLGVGELAKRYHIHFMIQIDEDYDIMTLFRQYNINIKNDYSIIDYNKLY